MAIADRAAAEQDAHQPAPSLVRLVERLTDHESTTIGQSIDPKPHLVAVGGVDRLGATAQIQGGDVNRVLLPSRFRCGRREFNRSVCIHDCHEESGCDRRNDREVGRTTRGGEFLDRQVGSLERCVDLLELRTRHHRVRDEIEHDEPAQHRHCRGDEQTKTQRHRDGSGSRNT